MCADVPVELSAARAGAGRVPPGQHAAPHRRLAYVLSVSVFRNIKLFQIFQDYISLTELF